jgi:hypothetical protein
LFRRLKLTLSCSAEGKEGRKEERKDFVTYSEINIGVIDKAKS